MGKKITMTIPTKITMVRLVMIPFVILCYCLQSLNEYLFILTSALFLIASMTDYLDGHIARKYNMVSDLGKLLDPIADKVLVAAGLFIVIDGGYIPVKYFALICTTIIIAREFMIGVIRQMAALKKVVLAADKLGKIKTATTMFALTFLLLSANDNIVFVVFRYAGTVLFALATLFTLISGLNYLIKNFDLILSDDIKKNQQKKSEKEQDGQLTETVHTDNAQAVLNEEQTVQTQNGEVGK